MKIPTGALSAAAAFAIVLSATPTTSLAYPLSSTPISTPSQTTVDTNPLRSLVDVLAVQSSSLWAALDSLYSDNYIATACDQEPC